MSGHTVGPWRVTGPDEGVTQIWGASTAGEVAAIGNPWMDEDEKEANARLICAAPDLLRACEAAGEIIERDNAEGADRWALWAQLDAAIKRAKGESGD